MTQNIHRLAPTQRGRRHLGVQAARQLREAEHDLDRALAGKLALAQMLLNGRIEHHFGVAIGQTAITDLARAFSLAVEARGALGEAHNGLAEVAQEHGIGWSLDGPGETKPTGRPFDMPQAVSS